MTDKVEQPEFWESAFNDKKEMWGLQPAKSAIVTKDFFVKNKIKKVLIPGYGYGRNAQVFKDNGINVTGIEISQTAIVMARKHYGTEITIHHGSVADMPFDQFLYDGLFCYALIHLLNKKEREKLIADCYNQLSENGYMFFIVISKKASTYKQGKFLSIDRYEIFEGVKMFYYDKDSISSEFGEFGLFDIDEVEESHPFFIIKCRKQTASI